MRLALIDGDLLCYRVSATFDETFDFGPGGSARSLDAKAAARAANGEVNDLADAIDADRVLVCLSDTKQNFRKGLYGRYKSQRPSEKPPLVYTVREALASEWPTIVVPRLEADDVMGLLSMDDQLVAAGMAPGFYRGITERVIVSCDKDMRTVPSLLFNPLHPEKGIEDIDGLEADRWFYSQILTGDSVDNYPGCPGIGPKSKYVAGVREAETEVSMWGWVIAGYAAKNLEVPLEKLVEQATLQGRMARILRPGEYSAKARLIKLWTPPSG